MRLRVRATIVALLVMATTPLAIACTDEEAPPVRPPSVPIAAGAGSLTIGGTFAPGVNRITFNNAGERPRNAQLVHLDNGRTPAELLALLDQGARWPDWARYVGGPGLTEPGRSMAAEVDLQPATYVLFSLLPANGGALQPEPGAVQAFAVTGDPTGADASRPTLTVTAVRGALEAPRTTPQGEVLLRLENEDDTPHDVSVFALDDGATTDDLVAYLDGRRSDPPGVFAGGVMAVEPGETGLAILFLAPGSYALVSLFPEPDGVTPGFQVGMIRPLTVE